MNQVHDQFLATADSIGARLCRDALWAGGRCNWLGASMEPVGGAWKVVQRTFGPDLYGGTSGIALFLGRLYSLVNTRLYRTTALGALEQALSRQTTLHTNVRASFYSGLLGIAYTCITLGELWSEERLIQRGCQLVEGLTAEDRQAVGIDVLSGRAGAIPGLLHIHRRYPRPFLLEMAVDFGEALLKGARRSDIGWSWNTLQAAEGDPQPYLTGFSHGAAGIGWALLELYQVTREKKWREAAEEAFRYERHWFNPTQMNWPDFRNLAGTGSQSDPGYMLAWCHGAPGIGLARLRAYALLGSAILRQEAEVAIQSTTTMLEQAMTSGQGNYSLCHGLGGNAELLLYGSTVLQNARCQTIAEQVGQQGIARYQAQRAPWPCGVMGAGETPNLMLGLAGIGYFFLRLYAPAQTPSIMILVPNTTT